MALIDRDRTEDSHGEGELVLGDVEVIPYAPHERRDDRFATVEAFCPKGHVFRPMEVVLESGGLPLDVRHPLRIVRFDIGMETQDPRRGYATMAPGVRAKIWLCNPTTETLKVRVLLRGHLVNMHGVPSESADSPS